MAVLWFTNVISENEWAFDLLYCVAFVVMDKQWLEKNATYMEFNVRMKSTYRLTDPFYEVRQYQTNEMNIHMQDVLKSTRAQVERELLMDDVLRIEDMPSYALLS